MRFLVRGFMESLTKKRSEAVEKTPEVVPTKSAAEADSDIEEMDTDTLERKRRLEVSERIEVPVEEEGFGNVKAMFKNKTMEEIYRDINFDDFYDLIKEE